MGWRLPWRRRRTRVTMAPFDRSKLPVVKAPTFDEMLEEGMLMAESAGRMALKNRLIVGALRGDAPYSDERAAAMAREVLYELVQEADEAVEHLAAERETAAQRDGRSQHQHDYHRSDLLNLRRREKVHAAVAKALWTRRSDEARDREHEVDDGERGPVAPHAPSVAAPVQYSGIDSTARCASSRARSRARSSATTSIRSAR